jgi:hypothetical protein
VEHARQRGASERHACHLVQQPRGTQRYQPTQRNDEDALTRAIITLADRYGRYGYRRITIKLQQSGWNVGKDRVERIWRREGLKVPQKQMPRRRLWLDDGCHRRDCESPGYYPLGDVHQEFFQFLDEVSADDHSVAHLKDYMRKLAESWSATHRTIEEKREIETKPAREQLQQLIHMKVDNLIADDEFRNQRALLARQLAEVTESGPHAGAKSEDVLAQFDTICVPLMYLAETWQSIPIEFRRRFQQILLPKGYVYGRVGTAQKAHILSFLGSPLPVDTNAVRPVGESWNQLAGEIVQIAMIFKKSAVQ